MERPLLYPTVLFLFFLLLAGFYFKEDKPQWQTMATGNLPEVRHENAFARVGNKFYLLGGRRSTARIGKVLELTVPEVDIFDFKTNTWRTLPASRNIPAQRAGHTAVALGNNVLIIGGESPQKLARNQTEALDVRTHTWHSLAPLTTGRHGTQAVVYRNRVFIAAGSANQGGGPERNTMEVLE
jgi:hypothetical protein